MAITDWYWKPTLPKVTDGSDPMLWDFTWSNRNRTHTIPNALNASSGDAEESSGTSFGTGFTTASLIPTINTTPQSLDVVPIDTNFSFQKHGRLTCLFNQDNPGSKRDPVGQWGYQPSIDFGFLFYIQDVGADTINQPLAPDSKNPRGCFIWRMQTAQGTPGGTMQLRAVPWDLGEPMTPDAGVALLTVAIPNFFHLMSIEWVTNEGDNANLGLDFVTPLQPSITFILRHSGPNDRRIFNQQALGSLTIDYTTVAIGDNENLNRGRPGNLNAGLIEPNGVEMFRGKPVGWNGVIWELLGADELVNTIISEDWELGNNPPPVLIHEETWELGGNPPPVTILEETWEPPAFLSTFTQEINEDWETP